MSSAPRPVDLTQVPAVPWAWVDEHVYAAIRGCSVKVLQRERQLNIGCPFRRINGTHGSDTSSGILRRFWNRNRAAAAALKNRVIMRCGDLVGRADPRLDCSSRPK